MFYKDEYAILKAKKEIEEAIKNGAPIVDLSIFDRLDSIKITDKNKNQCDYSFEIYEELAKNLKSFDENFIDKYLLTIKNTDIVDNQALEEEDSFLISLYYALDKKSAIDHFIEHYGKTMDKEEFISVHDILLEGTTSADKMGLRNDDMKFVGIFENNQKIIQYFPILQSQIDIAINKFLEFYNSNINVLHNDCDIFIKPIIYHGLIATLQLFNDGNTRYGRLFQTVELWGMINNVLDEYLRTPEPLVYPTKQYYPHRGEYRSLIKDLAIKNDNESWNNWITFNLYRIQDAIYASEGIINILQRRL